jgi:sec-independent protein translocase protein TatA
MGQIGAPELIIVMIIALIVLGPKRLPEVARSVGRGVREMRDALSGRDDDEQEERESLAERERKLAERERKLDERERELAERETRSGE